MSQRKRILAYSDELDRQPKNSCPSAVTDRTMASGGRGEEGVLIWHVRGHPECQASHDSQG